MTTIDKSAIKYKTEPLRCWPLAKELRANYYKEIAEAKEKGRILTTGSVHSFRTVLAGLGDFVHLGGEPYGASAAVDPNFAVECAEAVESRGYARDLCSYMRNYWGSMFINKYAFGGKFPKADFIFQSQICESQGKWYQVVKEFEGIPFYCVDFPMTPTGGGEQAKEDYVVGQLHEGIKWMEKVTGRTYDDEKLIEGVNNECRTTSLWGEICLLNQAIPAPLDQKTMISLHVNSILMRHKPEVVKFYEILKAEVEERVKKGIAALPTERLRLSFEGMPVWFFLDFFRHLEKYGAVCVMSNYIIYLAGTLAETEDGTFVRRQTPWEKGKAPRNREEALRTLTRWVRDPLTWFPMIFSMPQDKRSDAGVRLVKQWHIKGVVMHLNRGCEGVAIGMKENRLALINAGIPITVFEGNAGDRREFDEGQTVKRLETFMESMGLKKLAA